MYFLEKFTETLLRSLRSRGHFWCPEANFWISSIFNGFSYRIFFILSFKVVWPQQPLRPQKGLREFFQKLHFWNQCVLTKKMRYVTASWSKFPLNLSTEEVCKDWWSENLKLQFFWWPCPRFINSKELSTPLIRKFLVKPSFSNCKIANYISTTYYW